MLTLKCFYRTKENWENTNLFRRMKWKSLGQLAGARYRKKKPDRHRLLEKLFKNKLKSSFIIHGIKIVEGYGN